MYAHIGYGQLTPFTRDAGLARERLRSATESCLRLCDTTLHAALMAAVEDLQVFETRFRENLAAVCQGEYGWMAGCLCAMLANSLDSFDWLVQHGRVEVINQPEEQAVMGTLWAVAWIAAAVGMHNYCELVLHRMRSEELAHSLRTTLDPGWCMRLLLASMLGVAPTAEFAVRHSGPFDLAQWITEVFLGPAVFQWRPAHGLAWRLLVFARRQQWQVTAAQVDEEASRITWLNCFMACLSGLFYVLCCACCRRRGPERRAA